MNGKGTLSRSMRQKSNIGYNNKTNNLGKDGCRTIPVAEYWQ